VRQGKDASDSFEVLAVTDVRTACDALRPVYDALDGTDGFVSIEVSPSQAQNAEGSITEARRLWSAVNRPNLMVKVPGTVEGAEAVGALLQGSININITLLFSLENHERVMWKYIEALEVSRLNVWLRSPRFSSAGSMYWLISCWTTRLNPRQVGTKRLRSTI